MQSQVPMGSAVSAISNRARPPAARHLTDRPRQPGKVPLQMPVQARRSCLSASKLALLSINDSACCGCSEAEGSGAGVDGSLPAAPGSCHVRAFVNACQPSTIWGLRHTQKATSYVLCLEGAEGDEPTTAYGVVGECLHKKQLMRSVQQALRRDPSWFKCGD